MDREQALNLIRRAGAIVVMRATSADQLVRAADAVRAGGVRAIEVSLTTPGALGVIERVAAQGDEELLFGAGTVLDAQSARAAILAGAQFVVGPTVDPAMIEICRRYGIPVIPGGYTPTEVLAAWQAGADMVKVFPAGLGGPALIEELKGPLPQVEMVAVGGVGIENAAGFIRAGAAAVAVGGAVVEQSLLDAGDFAAMTGRARRLIEEIDRGRR